MPSKLYTLLIQIDQLPKPLNVKLRSNRWNLHRENNHWDMMIACKCESLKPLTPLRKAKISITRYSHRMLDYDGLVGSMKPVVDSLVSCGVLSDDSWGVTGKWDVDQKFLPKKDGQLLEIKVQEC